MLRSFIFGGYIKGILQVRGIVDMFLFERSLYAASDFFITQFDILNDNNQKPQVYEETGVSAKVERIVLFSEQAQPQGACSFVLCLLRDTKCKISVM